MSFYEESVANFSAFFALLRSAMRERAPATSASHMQESTTHVARDRLDGLHVRKMPWQWMATVPDSLFDSYFVCYGNGHPRVAGAQTGVAASMLPPSLLT